ncbi:septation regulator SpoVG [candidate division FCPU426 bacterium]|nr:septation regulator SpoVG [candidate division FCPU426 bacterium]
MTITDVKIFPRQEDKLKAYVTVTFDNAFVVHNLKIIEGANGLFVAMPSRKRRDGTYMDVAHPLNSKMRREMEERILAEYKKEALLDEFTTMPGMQQRQEAFETN